jgi:hypothetical protein
VVDVSIDHGRTWSETALGENVVAVVPTYRNGLAAYVQEPVGSAHASPAVTLQYVTRDGGRDWRYSTSVAGIGG